MNPLKSLLFLLFLFVNFSAFSQAYIEPITFKRSTGILAENADSMTLEAILGGSEFAVPQRMWSAIYSPDGNFMVVGGYSYIACFDQKTGKRIWEKFLDYEPNNITYHPVRGLAIHQKTNRLMVGTDNGKVWLLDFRTGETQKILAEKLGWVMSVAISPNGRFGASTDIKGKCKMWDLKTGNKVKLPLMNGTRGETVCFSSDGQFLAIGTNNAFYLVDWDNQTATKYDAPSTVQSITFINDDREVLISGWTGFVQRIHLKSKEVLWKSSTTDWLINLQVLPNKTSALAISPFYVLHIDWENNKITPTNIPVRTAMNLHPDGKTILTVGQFSNRVEQFDWATEKPINNSRFYTEPPMKLAFSPDGKYLAAAPYFTADKGIFWNTETWEIVGEIEGNKLHGYRRFEFTKDSKHFYATLKQNNSRIPVGGLPTYFKVPSFEPAKPGYRKTNTYHHTSVNLESMETAHLKKLLPIKTAAFFGKLEETLNRHLFGGFTTEDVYFAGVTNEKMLYIFDTKTGVQLAGTPLPDFEVVACAIHPEAKIVAVTAWDGLIYIYRW